MRTLGFVAISGLWAILLATPSVAQSTDGMPSGPFDTFVPEPGFTTTLEETPPDTELVKRLFALGYADQCRLAIESDVLGTEPEVWDLTYRDSYQEADEPDRTFRLYHFNCDAGAYNVISVFLTWDSFSGLAPLSLARPEFDITYENDDFDGDVLDIAYRGMSATNRLVNAWFDPDTGTIGASGKWRGLGDAADYSTWVQRGPVFVLDVFDVDASYDEAVNPWRIVAGGRVLEVPERLPEERFDEPAEDDPDGQ